MEKEAVGAPSFFVVHEYFARAKTCNRAQRLGYIKLTKKYLASEKPEIDNNYIWMSI